MVNESYVLEPMKERKEYERCAKHKLPRCGGSRSGGGVPEWPKYKAPSQ